MDLEQATEFLGRFNFENITLQFLKNSKPTGYAYGCDTDKLLDDCMARAKRNQEIFFMVNEGNGIVHDGKATCRTKRNVERLSACFIDTDEVPYKDVVAYLKSIKLKPHIVVETSPGKYHLYFLLEATAKTKNSIAKWEAIQIALAFRGDKSNKPTDTSMRDYSRVLRVPGFYHRKDKPFLTKLKKAYHHDPYTLDELLSATDAESFEDHTLTSNSEYQLQDHVAKGQRHDEISRYLGYLISKDVDQSIAKPALYSYIEKAFDNPEDFLPDGKRHSEIDKFIDWKEKEDRIEVLEQTIDKADNDPFALPDKFYFDCPGILGDITKHISERSLYPIPAFAWAATVAAIGTLKSRCLTSSLGHSPSNYFLCLAPTGSGKNYSQEIFSHTFKALSVQTLISHGIRSEKGIARFLEANGSCGLLLLDEAENLFNGFNRDNTPHYLRACKSLLLEAYSSTNLPYKHLGHTGDTKQKPITLEYPRLSVIAYGVNHSLQTAFNEKSIKDGLLQRFLVLTSSRGREVNPNFVAASTLNSNYFEYLQKLAIDSQHLLEEDLENPAPKKKRVLQYSKQALARYYEFRDHMDDLYNGEVAQATGLEGIFSRAAEITGRLATAIEESDHISQHTLSWCIELVESRTRALRQSSDSYTQGDLSRDVDDLVSFIASKAKLSEDRTVVYREIVRGFRVRDSRKLKDLIQSALDSDLLKEHKRSRGGKAYSILGVL